MFNTRTLREKCFRTFCCWERNLPNAMLCAAECIDTSMSHGKAKKLCISVYPFQQAYNAYEMSQHVITQDNYWQLNMDIFCLRRALFGDENHGCQQRHQEPTSKDGPNRVANVVRRRMLNLHAQCGDHLSVTALPPKRKRFGSKQTSKINKKSTLLPYFVTLFTYPSPSYSDASTRNCIDPAKDRPTGHLGVSEIKKSSHICC